MPDISFLFWNLNRKPLADRVARIVRAHTVDVVALAECDFAAGEFERVTDTTGIPFRRQSPAGRRLRVWSRIPNGSWGLAVDGTHWLVFRVERPGARDFLLVVAHLLSKLHGKPADQELAVRRLVRDIEGEERNRRHTRTILVGDLNMNPFEPGVASAEHLHAVMTWRKAGEEARIVDEQPRRMFYNPMWGLFGDRTPGPPGTYYSGPRGAVSYFWDMYDQVLVRPELMGLEVVILDSDGTDSLLSRRGLPDKRGGSDHLPILFRLKL